jgi:hypothetical protein
MKVQVLSPNLYQRAYGPVMKEMNVKTQTKSMSYILYNAKATLSLCMPSRRTGGADLKLCPFLTSEITGIEWTTSRSGCSTPRKVPRYPLNMKLGGHQKRVGRFVKDKKSLDPVGIRNSDRRNSSLASVPTYYLNTSVCNTL